MTKKLIVEQDFFDCPIPWQHFIDSLISTHTDWQRYSDIVMDRHINSKLAEFNGFFINNIPNDGFAGGTVEFETEQDLMMFILRWS